MRRGLPGRESPSCRYSARLQFPAAGECWFETSNSFRSQPRPLIDHERAGDFQRDKLGLRITVFIEGKSGRDAKDALHGEEKEPSMTEPGLWKLLEALSEDRERAAELYLHIQSKLIRYFAWNRCPHPEELSDEVVDRFARRLEEGERVEKPISYILGIARRVLLETKPKGLLAGVAQAEQLPDSSSGERDEELLQCLDGCLEVLAPETRAMLLEYYAGGSRITPRQRMADRMGLSSNALRNRMLRLRRNLESCIQACRQKRAEENDGRG